MHYQSARHFLGLPVMEEASKGETAIMGLVESVTINPKTLVVEGFLVGKAGQSAQHFLPRECVLEDASHHLIAHAKLIDQPDYSTRVLGLQAWTINPKFLAGFVYDFYLSLEDGGVESFVIHQLIRTWRIPASAVEAITEKALLINNDTTIKLKITPYITTEPTL